MENNENKVEETTTLSVNNSGADINSTEQIIPKNNSKNTNNNKLLYEGKYIEDISEGEVMSKYERLWKYIKDNNKKTYELSYEDIRNILGFEIDHSFLTYKKELKNMDTKLTKFP